MTVAAGTGVEVVIAGGGTGGHVYPALALAQELVRRGTPPTALRFLGTERGLEARAVPAAGFTLALLPARGLRRRLHPANLLVLWSALRATVRAVRLLRSWRPRVVVGVGGYASLPAVLAARLRRIPVVVHEQNAAPGLSNRVAVRVGAQAAVSIPGTPLAGAVVTGNPVRSEITASVRRPREDRLLVAVFGGSLGAARLNDCALDLYERWRAREDLAVHHVSGPRDHQRCERVLAARRRPDDALEYRLVRYEERMEVLYARASVALCRSGAVTVAELAAAGLPAVLVPFPAATADHQRANAEALVAAGGALLVPDDEADVEHVGPLLDALLTAPGRRREMGAALRALDRPDAAGALADLVEATARG